METSTDSTHEIQDIKRELSQQIAVDYIQTHYSHLSPELSYFQQVNCPNQLWQMVDENNLISWFFFSITLTEIPETHNISDHRVWLENILADMLLGEHIPNQNLSLKLSKALEIERLTSYRLHIRLNPDDFSLLSINQIEIDLSPTQATSPPPLPDEAQPEPTLFIDPQTLYDLSKQFAKTLAPQGFPIHSTLNPKLQHSAQIKPIQDRYQRTIDLSLEYSPAITEPELTEYLHRLSHYQTLKHLVHLHIFIQEQMQTWHQQNGQPSLGAIAPHLQHHIIELRDQLYQRIQTLTDNQLDSTAQTLKHEVDTFTLQQQYQQTLLDQLEKNPLLGYLDTHLLDTHNHLKETIQPFTDPNQLINIPAQHYKAKNSKSILSHIAPCQSEKYSAYHQRKPDRPALKLIIEYAITQKLYPQRPVFIGFAPKAIYPRLELLWGQTDETILTPSPLNQIWCIYPMLRTDPPQWLIIAATTDTQPLKTIPLENGQIAQEGTYEYLERSLHLMAQSEEEYTQAISQRITEALAHKRIKYLHVHQTQDSQTEVSRDILQMQFQLFS